MPDLYERFRWTDDFTIRTLRRSKSKAVEVYKDPEYVYFTNPATGDSIIWFDKDFKLYISDKVKEADREQLKKLFEPILENVKKEFIKSIASEIKNVLRKEEEEAYYGGPLDVEQNVPIPDWAQEQFNANWDNAGLQAQMQAQNPIPPPAPTTRWYVYRREFLAR